MAYVTPAEMNTHLYGEITAAIDRGITTLMESAIEAAQAEAEGYLSRYDMATEYAYTGVDRYPVLLLYVKDIAVWHFIQLANPNVDMALREVRYNKAIDWLKGVQKGIIMPDLPLPAPDTTDEQANNDVRWGNSRTRNKGYL